MIGARSLRARLLISLLFALWLGAGPLLLIMGTLNEQGPKDFRPWEWTGLSFATMRDLIAESVVRSADGDLEIVPTQELRAELKRAPNLAYAVYSEGSLTPLPGSSPEIAARLAEMNIWTKASRLFSVARQGNADCLGAWQWQRTQFGYKIIALCGHPNGWRWVFIWLYENLERTPRNFYPVYLIVAFALWIVLTRQLAPLRAVAAEAKRIDFESLDRRLPLKGVPSEIAPLIYAVNWALDRVEDAASRRQRFLANAAHELRTPLAVLIARLHGPRESVNISDLQQDAQKINAIVEQLLASARLDKAEGPLGQIDLAGIARSVVDYHVPLALRLGRRIEFETTTESIFAAGDRRAAESVIGNIVDNALRAEPQGGAVVVQVGPSPTVAVVDHGAGVDPADRELIFEPFWRKNETTPGSGLGLAIAKELMTKQGGYIRVEETAGGGATFKLSFQPAVGAQGRAPHHALSSNPTKPS
ncbi:sensor histidine kinase [Rhodoblastus sp.]|uniref:sensor histidine kinase n=1 Tax=Rhodoblastus sp. TaxID=1962975 RepID=UPI003F9488BD